MENKMKYGMVLMFAGAMNDISWNGVNFSIDPELRCAEIPAAAVEELTHHGLIAVSGRKQLDALLAKYEEEKAAAETKAAAVVEDEDDLADKMGGMNQNSMSLADAKEVMRNRPTLKPKKKLSAR